MRTNRSCCVSDRTTGFEKMPRFGVFVLLSLLPIVVPNNSDQLLIQAEGAYSLIGAIPNGEASVRSATQFGAICDGVADDWLSIQNAIEAGPGEVLIPNGRCRISHGLLFVPTTEAGNLKITGQGSSEIYFEPQPPFIPGSNMSAIYIASHTSERRPISGSIPKLSMSFEVSDTSETEDLQPGDWLIVEEYDLGAGNQVLSDWVQVSSVFGTRVNLFTPTRTAFPNSRPWRGGEQPYSGLGFIRVVPPIVNGIQISNLKITVPRTSTPLPAVYVSSGSMNVEIENVTIDNAYGKAIASYQAKGLLISGLRQVAARFACTEFAATVDLKIYNSYFGQEYSSNATDIPDTAAATFDIGTSYFDVSGNTFLGGNNIEVLMLVGVHDGDFSNNHLGWSTPSGSGIGFVSLGTQNLIFSNNLITGGTAARGRIGVAFANSNAYSINIENRDNVVVGNEVVDFKNSYELDSGSELRESVSDVRMRASRIRDQIVDGPVIESISATSAVIAWSTGFNGTSTVQYGSDGRNFPRVVNSEIAGQNHRVWLKRLKPGSTYYFVAISRPEGNKAGEVVSPITKIVTLGGESKTPDQIVHGPVIENIKASSAVIAWSTNFNGTSAVQYGSDGRNFPHVVNSGIAGQNHRVWLKRLKPGSTYYFFAISRPEGNKAGEVVKSDHKDRDIGRGVEDSRSNSSRSCDRKH